MRRLSRAAIVAIAGGDVELPRAEMLDLPEKVVQFGTGAFLRGFVDYFIDEANRDGRFNGRIVAVSSTGSSRDAALNAQDGLYTLAIRGVEAGESREQYRVVSSISRAISARDSWSDVLTLARDPRIELVISNTTEIGIVLDEGDEYSANPPRSFPGKLTRFLAERAAAFDYDPGGGLIILPCELNDENGARLRVIVRQLSERWALDSRFDRWLLDNVLFCNTIVDRIVPGIPRDEECAQLAASLGYRDDLLTTCEPYAFFGIEGDERLRARLGFIGEDTRIETTLDIRPYRRRKVRILNGGHTIVAPVALLAGLETVRDACEDERVGRFLRRAIFDEIVPTVDVPGAERFALDVMDRFANPHIRHALVGITLYGGAKLRTRVVPTILEYHARLGRAPASLAFGFAAYVAFMRGDFHASRIAVGLAQPSDHAGDHLRDAWTLVDVESDDAITDFVRSVCVDTRLWGTDLTRVNGFADAVGEHLIRIVRQGITSALDAHLTETAIT
jgi:tagaturonate reductase